MNKASVLLKGKNNIPDIVFELIKSKCIDNGSFVIAIKKIDIYLKAGPNYWQCKSSQKTTELIILKVFLILDLAR